MADKTTNYNLTKPADNEYYDIQIFNNNADIIDTELKERDTRVGLLTNLLTRIKTSIVNAINGLQTDFNEHKAESTAHGTAAKAEAQAGTSHASYMTPLRTKEAIQSLQAVSSVNGKTGAVNLTKADVGLDNVTNVEQINAIASSGNVDPNTVTIPNIVTIHANNPIPNTYFYILTLFYSVKTGSRVQIAVSYGNLGVNIGSMFFRHNYDDVWSGWTELFTHRNYGNVTVQGGTFTLGLPHVNSVLMCNLASTITIPNAASVNIPVGAQFTFVNVHSSVTFVPSSGVTLNSKDSKRSIDGKFASATLIKSNDDHWYLIGALK